MRFIETNAAPAPGGHYSQAVVFNGLVFVSGQLPFDPANRNAPIGTMEQQAEQTLKNVAAVLEAAGSDLEHVLQLTVYVADMEHWGVVNAVCMRMFGDHRPSRAVVPVNPLHYGYGIEIQAIGEVKG